MEKLDNKIKEVAESIRKQVTEALFDVECEILPYVEEDTIANAMLQAEEIVRNILEGSFDWDGDYIVIRDMRELTPRIRIAFSTHDWDALRDRIIERMPECPKDAKIASLEASLKRAYDRY